MRLPELLTRVLLLRGFCVERGDSVSRERVVLLLDLKTLTFWATLVTPMLLIRLLDNFFPSHESIWNLHQRSRLSMSSPSFCWALSCIFPNIRHLGRSLKSGWWCSRTIVLLGRHRMRSIPRKVTSRGIFRSPYVCRSFSWNDSADFLKYLTIIWFTNPVVQILLDTLF